jgi:c-di-GMP-binding flagellar brake protein YcgR
MDNRRKHQRFQAAVAAELDVDGELYEGETRDLSQGGASVLVRGRLREGMQVALTLFITEDGIEKPDQEPLSLMADVIWSVAKAKGAQLVGLRFAAPAPEDAQRLSQLLAVLGAR